MHTFQNAPYKKDANENFGFKDNKDEDWSLVLQSNLKHYIHIKGKNTASIV